MASPSEGAKVGPRDFTLDAMRNAMCEKVMEIPGMRRQAATDYVLSDPLNIYGLKDKRDKRKDEKEAVERAANIAKAQSRKRNKDDIFREFKEEDERATQEVYIGGMTIHRFNVQRFWQSDVDLHRWQDSLNHHTRYHRLLIDVRKRWHEDFDVDQAHLMMRHNTFFRSRSESVPLIAKKNTAEQFKQLRRLFTKKEQKAKKKKEPEKPANPFADRGSLFGDGGPPPLEKHKSHPEEVSKEEKAILNFLELVLTHWGTVEEAFRRLDSTKSGTLSFTELQLALQHLSFKGDLQLFWRLLDKDHNGAIERDEFLNLKPYLLRGLATHKIGPTKPPTESDCSRHPISSANSALGEDDTFEARRVSALSLKNLPARQIVGPLGLRCIAGQESSLSQRSDGTGTSLRSPARQNASATSSNAQDDTSAGGLLREQLAAEAEAQAVAAEKRGQARGLPQVRMPRTVTLLLVRNADPRHTGETFFMQHRPESLEKLLVACGEVCRPVVPPVEALLDAELRPVRSLEELQQGSAYLLKGHEALDPPVAFFGMPEPGGFSLRELRDLRVEASKGIQGKRLRPLRSASEPANDTRSSASWPWEKAGSPPWLSTGSLSPSQVSGGRWKPPRHLAASMSWMGQGCPPVHHEYESWQPVLRGSEGNSSSWPSYQKALDL